MTYKLVYVEEIRACIDPGRIVAIVPGEIEKKADKHVHAAKHSNVAALGDERKFALFVYYEGTLDNEDTDVYPSIEEFPTMTDATAAVLALHAKLSSTTTPTMATDNSDATAVVRDTSSPTAEVSTVKTVVTDNDADDVQELSLNDRFVMATTAIGDPAVTYLRSSVPTVSHPWG